MIMRKFYTLLLMLVLIPVCAHAQGKPIEGYTELDRNDWGKVLGRFRYELTYDREGWRQSEYIYYAELSNSKWGEENLYDIGHYTYEKDAQGRVKSKSVTYDMGKMTSYRIVADYTVTPVRYAKYKKNYDSTYEKESEWTCHSNGALASYTDAYGNTDYFNESGDISRGTGTLNDSTFTYDNGTSETINEHYRYDAKIGRLAEYSKVEGEEMQSMAFGYDSFGRISKAYIKYKDHFEDYEDEVTFTYFNDEYYPVGNSWRDVFFFEGPVTEMVVKENGEIIEKETYKRDTQGKLLSVERFVSDSNDQSIPYYLVENGYITKRTDVWKTYNWETDQETTNEEVTTYTWKGEEITKMTRPANTQAEGDDERNMETVEYTHGSGKCTMKIYDKYDAANNRYDLFTITEKDGKYTITDEEGDYCLVRTIQKEDFSVTRPNVGKDLDGFCPELSIPISVKDRVTVTANYAGYDGGNECYGFAGNIIDYFEGTQYAWYANISSDNYYDVRHEGDSVVCYDIKGRPVFTVKDGLLTEERWYDDYISDNVVYSSDMPALAPRKAEAETTMKNAIVIEYQYNDKGWCSGQNITIYDENGEATSEDYTYKYDLTPVTDINADGQGHNYKVAKDGRIYIVRDGRWYTTTGIQIR